MEAQASSASKGVSWVSLSSSDRAPFNCECAKVHTICLVAATVAAATAAVMRAAVATVPADAANAAAATAATAGRVRRGLRAWKIGHGPRALRLRRPR